MIFLLFLFHISSSSTVSLVTVSSRIAQVCASKCPSNCSNKYNVSLPLSLDVFVRIPSRFKCTCIHWMMMTTRVEHVSLDTLSNDLHYRRSVTGHTRRCPFTSSSSFFSLHTVSACKDCLIADAPMREGESTDKPHE